MAGQRRKELTMNNDLISRSALWSDIQMLPHNGDMISSEEVEQAINEAPTVEAELEQVAQDLLEQFAYKITYKGRAAYTAGGLSALEAGFAALGWDDPRPAPECECQHPGCHEWATCGTPTKDGYKRLCSRHYEAELANREAEKNAEEAESCE